MRTEDEDDDEEEWEQHKSRTCTRGDEKSEARHETTKKLNKSDARQKLDRWDL